MTATRVCALSELEQDSAIRVEVDGVPIAIVRDSSDEVHAIGGNVADSVTRSVFPLDESGFLPPISGRRFFTVIENRLP